MSHNCGRVVTVGTRIGPDAGAPTTPGVWELLFTPSPALLGGDPRFVMLHFTNLSFPGTARLEVNVGYGTDTIVAAAGADAWTRPIDPTLGPIRIRYFGTGAVGGVTLENYASGEPTQTGTPGNPVGSLTNVDLFLHTDPYVEPVYETRLKCGVFDWLNAGCAAPGSVEARAAAAVCCFVHVHTLGPAALTVGTCSGTLIDTNLVLTASHCATDPNQLEVRSGSVCFGYETTCAGGRPPGYTPKIFKVTRIVSRGTSDWLILEIDTPAGGTGITPATMRPSPAVIGETLTAIHHPHGAVKKMQQRTLAASGVVPAQGFDFAGGSSGSSMFDSSGKIVGGALSVGPVAPPGSPAGTAPDACFAISTPATTILQEIANPPAPPTPFDVMLVMDRSGSMGSAGTLPGRTKMREAQDAASLFVQLIRSNAGDRIGLVSFSTTATNPPDAPLGLVTAAKKFDLVGPAPFTSGRIGALQPGGVTSIGAGISVATGTLSAGANARAILLMTDGLQNTAPMIAAVEGALGPIRLVAIGFGAESSLDSALLSRVARDHNGLYKRANDGLELKKFFSLAFGNIFASGALADPYVMLRVGETATFIQQFEVCDETRITAIVGWDNPSQGLTLELRTPGGIVVGEFTAGIDGARGLTWQFLRIPLPFGGERAGSWSWTIRRVIDAELPTPQETVRLFVTVIADGGPRIEAITPRRPIYTGDPLTPSVLLRYPDGTAPSATMTLELEAPDSAVGEKVAAAGLAAPHGGADPLSPFLATLQGLAGGGEYVLPTRSTTLELFDDGEHDDGAMEPDGIYSNRFTGMTPFEGTYRLRAVARYENGAPGAREAQWAVHVALGIDPVKSTVVLTGVRTQANGARGGQLVVTPRDRFGNRLGPGRPELLPVVGGTGTTIGPVSDNADGSYTVDATWDPATVSSPSIVIMQPDRPPATLVPNGAAGPARRGCRSWLVVLAIIIVVLFVAWMLM